jgi:hypothetical protein
MNNDAVINKIAHTVGCSRKEVLDILKQFGALNNRTIPRIKKGS